LPGNNSRPAVGINKIILTGGLNFEDKNKMILPKKQGKYFQVRTLSFQLFIFTKSAAPMNRKNSSCFFHFLCYLFGNGSAA
jgi:hypothetical protein